MFSSAASPPSSPSPSPKSSFPRKTRPPTLSASPRTNARFTESGSRSNPAQAADRALGPIAARPLRYGRLVNGTNHGEVIAWEGLHGKGYRQSSRHGKAGGRGRKAALRADVHSLCGPHEYTSGP